MNRLRFDSDSMKLIMFFESMTGTKVKDCIIHEKLTFIISEGEMGKAIGKNGVNIRKVEMKLKKKIKLVEFSNDILQFVKNIIYPIEVFDINNEDGIVTIFGKDANSKAMLIGRERKNINHVRDIVQRYFDVKEIRVV